MNCKEAFRKSLSHEEVSPVPFTIKFTAESKENWTQHLGREFDPILDTGSYVVASHTNNGWREVEPGYWEDYFGVIWNKTQDKTLGIVDNPPLADLTFGDYAFPSPDDLPVYTFIEENNRRYPDRFHMVSIGFSLFERAWSLTGMEELMIGLATEPEFIGELLDRITEYNNAVVKNAAQLGVDCLHLGDDWGSQGGPIISPDMWREAIKPRFAETCKIAHDAGLLVSLHCCGNVEPLFDDIIEAGVDVFDPFQPEAMDIWKLRETYRGQLAFWGGLSVQQTFPFGTPEEVKAEGEKLLAEMAPGGGYILAPAHSLTGDVPVENIQAFLDLAQSQ